MPKQRISVFRLNRNKQKNNRNSLVCFGSIPKQRVSMFRLNLNKQKTNQNSLIESIFWYFGLFRNSSVCFSCFDMGSKHRNKQKFFDFGFTKQTETQPKKILFRFVSVRTEIFFCLFRGHPIPKCPYQFNELQTLRRRVYTYCTWFIDRFCFKKERKQTELIIPVLSQLRF
jgi:hypothetical protein